MLIENFSHSRKRLKMKASLIATLSVFVLVTVPSTTNGLCMLKHNGTLAQCHYLDDIKYIKTYELKSLKVTSVGKHLSADVFGNITTLQHLDLSNGKLRRIEPGTFANLHNLRSIDLSNNHLTHLSRGTFEGPMQLRVLNLRRNSLTRIPFDAVDLKDLKFLELSSNKLQCDCRTLKTRDELISRGVITPKKTMCSGPGTLKGHILTEPDAEVICMFEKQDSEPGMQKDEAIAEGSGETRSDDAFDEIEPEDIPEESDKPIPAEPEATEGPTSSAIEIPLTTVKPSAQSDELFFSEEDKHSSTSPSTKATESSSDLKPPKTPDVLTEGSGDDDLDDGSGLEASGIPMVPPITWDDVKADDVPPENVSPNPTTTTTSGGMLDSILTWFWGEEDTTTTVAPPSTSTVEEFGPEDEGFIGVSSTTEAPAKPPVDDIITPGFVAPVGGEKKPKDETKARILDDSKTGEVKGESPVVVDGTEGPDASATKQSKKGMGSYVVLGVLLGVLGALIGVAAYKGDFCRKARKRNGRPSDSRDAENGTELKDLTKSLLDKTQSAQPKVTSNGNKSEASPLVTTPIPEEIKSDDEPTAKYIGTISESIDPIKPPRKSFSPSEDGRRNGTNGNVVGVTDEECPRVHSKDHLVNGKIDRDSLSSIGEAPSSHSRNSNPVPSSPSAQKVKITLQDNPDSVPKTPLLITRTKTGENLVKTP